MIRKQFDRKSNKKLRWFLISATGILAVAVLPGLFDRAGFFGPESRHLRDRWDAGQFDLSDSERQRLRRLPIEFTSYGENDADRTLEQTKLGNSHVLKGDDPVTRHEQIASFQKDSTRKVAVTSEEFQHFFQAYANQDHPVFITSDSILNAFHRILEDSILKLEFRQIEQLQRLLPTLEERLLETRPLPDSKVARSALRRAQAIVGVARQLTDPKYVPDSKIRQIVQEATAQVEGGTGQSLPAWLGEPRPSFLAIDYSRFTPEGLHSRSDSLQRHYRAVRWLQTIPFFVDNDEHLISLKLLGDAAQDTQWAVFAETYRNFFGGADDWDLQALQTLAPESFDLANSVDGIRASLLQRFRVKGPPGRINDLIAAESNTEAPETLAPETFALRILSAYRTPDAILFQSTAEWTKPPASFGLLFCTALGSEFARKLLIESNESDWMGESDRVIRWHNDDSVYGEYLQCLATLLKPTDSPPDFMSTDHWQLKSCQTVLGGWTQMRHTFALQAKQSHLVLSMSEHVGAGFVEPNPEFFLRLSRLASRIEVSLGEMGAFEISYEHLRFRLNELARSFKLIRALEQEGLMNDGLRSLATEDREFVYSVFENIGSSSPQYWVEGENQSDGQHSERVLAAIVQLSDCVARGELPEDRAARGALISGESSSNRVRWLHLVTICDRLADVARRQLDNQPVSKSDEYFITNYGEELARLLNYESYSASNPCDDAMRCISVLTGANGNHVHIAIARPRAIYVLYPHRGEQLLCRGAVFPYFEFTDNQIVDDRTWKSRIDTASTPARPRWLETLFTDD